jgi:hypothetical protein
MIRRRLFKEKDLRSLWVLALGTSDTWGAGIVGGYKEPTPYTYPSLVGTEKVKNLALRASGPGYPAVCLESLVGEKTYGVIIIEYMLRADEGLKLLATRLRSRFPGALLIFLDIWYPRMIRVVNSGIRPDKESIGLEAYQKGLGFNSLHDPGFIKHLERNPHTMFLKHRSDLQEIQKEIVRSVNGYIWHFPIPEDHNQLGAHIAQMAQYFSDDYKHLSNKGHLFVGRGIKRLLLSIPARRVMMRHNDWEAHDSCETWMFTGRTTHKHGDRIKMVIFDRGADKHALEIDPSGGTLLIQNPFDNPAALYISYMAGALGRYPRTRVTIGDDSMIVTPKLDDETLHVAMTSKVGVLRAGGNSVRFEALDAAAWPFRVVATSITQVEADDLGKVNMQAISEQQALMVTSTQQQGVTESQQQVIPAVQQAEQAQIPQVNGQGAQQGIGGEVSTIAVNPEPQSLSTRQDVTAVIQQQAGVDVPSATETRSEGSQVPGSEIHPPVEAGSNPAILQQPEGGAVGSVGGRKPTDMSESRPLHEMVHVNPQIIPQQSASGASGQDVIPLSSINQAASSEQQVTAPSVKVQEAAAAAQDSVVIDA